MSKQDRQGVRTAADLEQKYKFNERFAELLGIATDAREKVEETESTLREEMTEQYTNLSRTTGQISAEVGGVRARTESVEKSLASLVMASDSIRSEVRTVQTFVDANTASIQEVRNYATSIENLADRVEIKVTELAQDGVTKVGNTTGTFDEDGLTIDKDSSPTKTQITPDGMEVYAKRNGGEEAVLTASSAGVEARNLEASTYLIVGGRSRFENYGSDRTGCFWVG